MSLDILISFDTTGSMMPCISEVRRKVTAFVDTIYDTYKNDAYTEGVRIGIIAHGDYCDAKKKYVTKHSGFRSRTAKEDIIRFINRVEFTDGGDADECYELVLHEANTVPWEAEHRIMILIGDAEPHSPSYRENVKNLDWKEEAYKLIHDMGVLIYPVQCLRFSNNRDYFYDGLAKLSKVPKLELAQFSNITQLLTAVAYKQVSNEAVLNYGKSLHADGELNRNLANIINLLLEADSLVGGLDIEDDKPAKSKAGFRFTVEKADLEAVHPARFQVLHVDYPCVIRSFVELSGAKFRKGSGFYQLTKPELVQELKEVVIRERATGDMFSGKKAREMIFLPYGERGTVSKHNVPAGYDVFIQSTSYTRKLTPGTEFLYEVEDYHA